MTNATRPEPGIIADAPRTNWVDTYAPAAFKPYCKLARYDRPIGTWLLLLPCWYGSALAHLDTGSQWPNIAHMALFAVGAIAMRGSGCTWNDIVDRKFDGRVERTALRPIPSGQVTVKQAVAFAILQALVGLLVLLQFNAFTISLAIASLILVALYPFAKRYTYWPQFVLGMTFNWGALVGWSAATGSLSWTSIVLYAGSIAWTIGYDTIYAHQDKEDDALLGLKSTALRFGEKTPQWLILFYTTALSLFLLASYLAGAGAMTYAGLAIIAVQLAWQVATLDTADPANCLTRFKSNRTVGLIFTVAIIADMALR
jgi:4-hydroxybenzoate polyprenyltransferase